MIDQYSGSVIGFTTVRLFFYPSSVFSEQPVSKMTIVVNEISGSLHHYKVCDPQGLELYHLLHRIHNLPVFGYALVDRLRNLGLAPDMPNLCVSAVFNRTSREIHCI
jgi:hypothetical protein